MPTTEKMEESKPAPAIASASTTEEPGRDKKHKRIAPDRYSPSPAAGSTRQQRATAAACVSFLKSLKVVNGGIFVENSIKEEPGEREDVLDEFTPAKKRGRPRGSLSGTGVGLPKRSTPKENNNGQSPTLPNVICPAIGCEWSGRSRDQLVLHAKEKHSSGDNKFDTFIERFPDEESFLEWKCSMERSTVAYFQKRTERKDGTSYYICNRTGKYHRKKHPMQRSHKCHNDLPYCTAFFTSRPAAKGGMVVNGCLSHLGHDLDARRLPLTMHDKEVLVHLMFRESNYGKIVEILQREYPNTHRMFHITPHELKNFRSRYNNGTLKLTDCKKGMMNEMKLQENTVNEEKRFISKRTTRDRRQIRPQVLSILPHSFDDNWHEEEEEEEVIEEELVEWDGDTHTVPDTINTRVQLQSPMRGRRNENVARDELNMVIRDVLEWADMMGRREGDVERMVELSNGMGSLLHQIMTEDERAAVGIDVLN